MTQNADQTNSDNDALGDACDLDDDNDGLPDDFEEANGLNPRSAHDARLDSDGDGLDNLTEYHFGTDINNPDSDGDGVGDYAERAAAMMVPIQMLLE